MKDPTRHKISTRLLHEDRLIASTRGAVNPPVHHASTLLFDTLEEFDRFNGVTRRDKLTRQPGQTSYGLHGNTIQAALAQAITSMENGHDTIVTASGLMAVTLALGAVLESGDHLLMTDSAYGPSRSFCNNILAKQNIQTTYYDPCIGAGIEALVQENTKAIFLESPGTYTFEVQDLPAITAIAKSRNIITLADNTWATPLYYQPLDLGVDISIHAATKYFSGHSDVLLGTITANAATYPAIHKHCARMGNHAAPDDCYLVLRGIRTLAQRLKQHQNSSLTLADWLSSRDEVKTVIHPGRPDHPDHALWHRDFSGASGLFSFILDPYPHDAMANMLDNMQLFGMGFSWGGFGSLLIPANMNNIRSVRPWPEDEILMRIHVGLEDPDDLIADLDAGFKRLNETG